MMEPPCAPPCPPGPTSLALPTSSSSISLASERGKFNPSTTSETSLNPKQDFQDLIELSPDSGNGEELDEFDPLKSPVKAADVKCEERRPSITAALEAQIISESGACEKSDNLILGNSQYKNLTSDANETGQPSVFEIDPDIKRAKEKAPGMQITPQSDSTSSDDSQSQENQYSPAYNFGQLESSLLASCNPSFQCGPFTSACGSVGGLGRCNELNGPFNLPEGADPVLDAGTYNAPYLLGADGSTTIRPFSMVSKGDNMRGYPAAMRSCAPVGVQQQPSNPTRNPSYPRCLRGRPTRRYTNHEVVRKQPTAGGLLTNSCDLITSHPGQQCFCVNPGTSHNCAARVSENSLLGVLNPMFEREASNNQVNNTSMPLLPRKYSMDYSLSSRGLQLPELTRAPVPIKSFSACYPNNSRTNLRLPYNPQVMTRRGSDTISSICGPAQQFPTSPSEAHVSNCQIQDQQHPSTSIVGQHPLNGEAVNNDSQIDGLSHSKTNVSRSTMSYAMPPLVTSPDWFTLMTPPRDSYTQRLFTPDDLQDELLYPAPYGLKSEIYQNLNAREADFVLQKPSRKPRTEPLPSSCLPMTPKKRSESPEIKEGIIQPLATEDEQAQIEGALESRRVSLKERRKSSLEKIYIPQAGEPIDSVLNVKIDNFDRDEYVKYKKSFGENDLIIPSFTELLKKNSNSLISSSSDINPCATDDSNVLPKNSSQTAAPNKNTSPDSKISSNNISKDYNQPSSNDKHTSMNTQVPDFAKSPEKYKDKQSLREIRNWNSRTRIVPMSKQRSLEETEDHTPSEEKRKQSLPTEDLFGLRRPRTNRKASLAALSDCHFHKINSSGAAAFSPVSEADEIISKFSESNSKQTYSPHSNYYLDDHSKRSMSQPKKDTSSREKSKEKRKYRGILDKEFPSGSPKSRVKRSENSIHQQRHHHQRPHDTTETRHHHHHYHHQRQENPQHQHHHQRSHETTDHHQRPHATTEPRHPMKSTGSREDEMSHKSGFYGSSRKAQRKMGESHTNRMAPLSPPGPRSASDLFSQPGCEFEEPRTQRGATVPYEPLVDVLTPSTPDMPSPASGATRKRQHRRRKKDNQHHHHHHPLEPQHNPMAEGDDLGAVLSSTSSTPPLFPVSRSSSSTSTSSTLTSHSGSSHRGSPPAFSSSSSESSESSSSGTDSSSDSSSESSSSSSSSSSSDIEDLIL